MAGESAQRTNLSYEHTKYSTVRTELRTFLVIPIKILHLLLTGLRTFTGITVKHAYSSEKKTIVSSAILVLELRTKRSSCM